MFQYKIKELRKNPHPCLPAGKAQPLSHWERGVSYLFWKRRSWVRAVFILFAFLLINFKFCFAATTIDPFLKWKTIETQHFSIHYYTELEDIALKFAPIAEKVHSIMSKVLKYRLDMKTQVTLLDITDYGNGFTSPFPYPNITLYLADLGSNLNPFKYDEYLYYLFLHEYTHALHLDIAEGGVSIFRAIFGRTMFPNALEPEFMTEGIATYMETKYTNAGRGRDPRWQMMMRMDVMEDNLKSIDQAAVNTVKWPMGHLRYLYGVMFLQYLSDQYGEEKLVSLAHIYGDLLFSVGIDGAFTFVYKKNLIMLWNEWLDDLREKYQKQAASLGKLTEPSLLTETGYYHYKPKWSKDSQKIYYVKRDADEYPQIREYDLSSRRSEKLFEGMVTDDSLSLSPDGKYLLFSKADNYKNYYNYKDLYLLDLSNNRLERLTEGLRSGDPAFSPDGGKIIFVHNQKGERDLMLYDWKNQKKSINAISSPEPEAQYFSPSYSPDGKQIAAAKHTNDGKQRIYLIDSKNGNEKLLNRLDNLATEANPTFSYDGEYVLFDSDRSGIVNLYAYHVKTNRLFQLTNVLGGAMMPDLSADGKKLAYISYSSRGYDVAAMEVDLSSWKEIIAGTKAESLGYNPVSSETEGLLSSKSQKYSTHDYDPFPSLMPTFWIPYSYFNENGDQTSIYIGGRDPLNWHTYYLDLGYDFNAKRPSYSVYYANNQLLPQITVGLSDGAIPYNWNNGTYWEREQMGELLFTFYDNRVFTEYDRQALTLGLQNIKLTNITSLDVLNPKPSRGNMNALILSWRYLSTRMYAASISPEDGIDLKLMIENNSPTLNSDYIFTNCSAAFRQYLKAPLKHHVFATAFYGFYSKGDQLVQSNFSWRYLTLRGYPSNIAAGNKGLSLSLEYRFPLWYAEKGWIYGSTFLDRIWGLVFCDYGGGTFAGLDQINYKRSYGAELDFDISSLWGYMAATLKLGYAKGLDPGGDESVYFTIGL